METKTPTAKPTPTHPKAVPVVTDLSKVAPITAPSTSAATVVTEQNEAPSAQAYSLKILEQGQTVCTPFGNVIAPKGSVVVTCGRESYPLSLFAFQILTEKQ